MKEVEVQAKTLIDNIFEMEQMKKPGHGEINLEDDVNVLFPKITQAKPPFENYEAHELSLAAHYKMADVEMGKSQFRSIYNTFVNAENLFYQLVVHFYSLRTQREIEPVICQITIPYLRVAAQMMDKPENVDSYYAMLEQEDDLHTSRKSEICLSSIIKKMFEDYESIISQQGHQTVHGFSFRHFKGLLMERITEVLCKLNILYQTD